MKFQLFRPRFIYPQQGELFEKRQPEKLLRDLVEAQPAHSIGRGRRWRIGNLRRIDDNAVYFAFGRLSTTKLERFDELEGRFTAEEFETAPYTHVLMDFSLQVCAVGAKAGLAPNPETLGRNLARLLTAEAVLQGTKVAVDVPAIQDPTDFIAHLLSAYAIRSFTVTFKRPNPFDVEKDFQAPYEKVIQETEAKSGQARFDGPALNAAPLVDLTRAAAAGGTDAKARIVQERGTRPVLKRLRGNEAIIVAEDLESEEGRQSLAGEMRRAYIRVRSDR